MAVAAVLRRVTADLVADSTAAWRRGTSAPAAGVPGVVEEEGSKAAAGEQPGAGAGKQVTIYADVIDVDKAQQTIRVKGVDNTLTLKVKDPAQFALIAKGDQIKAVQTTAIAIGIVPKP